MDLKALSSIYEEKKAHIVDSSRGKEEKESLRRLFSSTRSLDVRVVSLRKRINDSKRTIQTLHDQINKQSEAINLLTKKVKDEEEKVTEFRDLANTFKTEKEAAEAKLIDLSKDIDEVKSVETPLTIEYNSETKQLKLGREEKEDVSFEDFSNLISTLGVVMPDLKVKLTVERIENKASVVKDSLSDIKSKIKDDEDSVQTTEVQKAANAIKEYIDTYSVKALKEVNVSNLPSNLQYLTKEIRDEGFLTSDVYDEYVAGAKEELKQAGVASVPFVLLKDSLERNINKFKEKLKSLGIYDSVWKRIPGTPSKTRISDTKSLYGFNSPTVIKEGKTYIIFE